LTFADLAYLLPELSLLATAVLVFLLDLVWPKHESERRARTLPIIAVGGLALAGVLMIPSLTAGGNVVSMLALDPFAAFFKAIALAGVALVIAVSVTFMPARTRNLGEYYAMLVVAALAVSLAVSANNFVMVYLAMEFLSITSYILAGYLRNDRKSGEGAIKYFLYGSTASATMLYGMSLLYGATGTTDLSAVAASLASLDATSANWLTVPAIIMLLAGFGFKASLVPFHQWAPDTYEGAPTPVTAFLSTVSKATGFAIMIRVFFTALGHEALVVQWTSLLVAVSLVTMTLGNLTALRQTNIKRMLAYSSIAQAGYILIGVASVLAEPNRTFTGLNGVLIYLLAYLFTNVGAFGVVAAVEEKAGATEIRDYAGLVRRSPWLAGLLFVFLASLTGIPPTGGFMGKFFVFGSAVQSKMWVLLVVAAVNSVIAAFYYLNVVRYMFFTSAPEGAGRVHVTRSTGSVLGIAAVVTLLLGVAPQTLIRWASDSAQTLLLALR
jgi:proton-translocating NADH-quinone oxidoreductase chain N